MVSLFYIYKNIFKLMFENFFMVAAHAILNIFNIYKILTETF